MYKTIVLIESILVMACSVLHNCSLKNNSPISIAINELSKTKIEYESSYQSKKRCIETQLKCKLSPVRKWKLESRLKRIRASRMSFCFTVTSAMSMIGQDIESQIKNTRIYCNTIRQLILSIEAI